MNTYIYASDAPMVELLRSTVQTLGLSVKSALVRDLRLNMDTLIKSTEPCIFLICNQRANLVSDLNELERLTGANPQISVILISEADSKEDLVRAMRSGVREVLSFPVNQNELISSVKRVMAHQEKWRGQGDAYVGHGQIIGFISCKGGCGATFLATNMAYLMADEFHRRCAFVDLDLQYGDASFYLSHDDRKNNISDLTELIERLDSKLLSSCLQKISPNLSLLGAPDEPGVALAITAEQLEQVLALANRMHESVVLDLDRNIDAVTLKALDMADVIYIVMEGTLPVVRNAKRLVKLFKSLGYSDEKMRLLVNKYQDNDLLDIKNIEQAVGLNVHRTLPMDSTAVNEAFNLGKPLGSLFPQNKVLKNLREITSEALHEPMPKARGWLNRWMGKAA